MEFNQIQWGATLWYNCLRAFCTGLVVMLLFLVTPVFAEVGFVCLLFPIAWPIVYVTFMLPIGLLLSFIAKFFPIVNLFAVIISLESVSLGDPIVFLLSKFNPNITPVESPAFFSFRIIFFVYKPENILDPDENEFQNNS